MKSEELIERLTEILSEMQKLDSDAVSDREVLHDVTEDLELLIETLAEERANALAEADTDERFSCEFCERDTTQEK